MIFDLTRVINILTAKYFVMDEVDELLNFGFYEGIKQIQSYLPKGINTFSLVFIYLIINANYEN